MPAGVDYSVFAVTCYGSYDPEYDGDLEIPDGTRTMCDVLRSTDNGETWGTYAADWKCGAVTAAILHDSGSGPPYGARSAGID